MQNSDFVRTLKTTERTNKGKYPFKVDFLLVIALIVLLAISMLALFSATGENIDYINRQLAFIGAGFFLMLLISQISTRTIELWAFYIFGLTTILLILVIIIGIDAKGAQRWLDLIIFRLQPSELLKVSLPLALAAYLGRRATPPIAKHVFWSIILISVPSFLIIFQPDLGTGILVFATGVTTLFLAGLRRRYIAGSLFIFLLTIPLMWIFMLRDYQKQRILTLLSPEDDLLGSGWNIVQSKTAIGSGGLYGKGWLNGTQSQLDFLPESHTDFIIAVLAEEFGLFGVVCTLTAYAFLLSRCFFISAHAKSQFGRLFAGSFAVMIFAHIFVNLGMVSGILPIVGAPLPLISFGGNSALTLFMGFGILTSISHEPRRIRS